MIEKRSQEYHNMYMTEQARIPTGEQQAPQKELVDHASAEIDKPTIISRLRIKNPNDTGEMAQMIIVPIKDAVDPTRIIDYHILEVNQLEDIFANTQRNQENSTIYFGRELQGKKGITFGGDTNSIDQGISRIHGYLIQDKEEGKITIHNEGQNGTTLSPLTECAIGETSINARQIVTAPAEGTTITFKGQDYTVDNNGNITSGGQLYPRDVLQQRGLYLQIIDGSLYCKSEVQIKITVPEPPSQQNETQPFIELPDANASPRETLEQVAQPPNETPGTITFSEQAALESQQSIPLPDGSLKFRVNSNGMISIIRYDANGNNIDIKAMQISRKFNYAGCRFISDGTKWIVTVEQSTPTQNTSETANTPEGNAAKPDVEAPIPVEEIPVAEPEQEAPSPAPEQSDVLRDENYVIPIESPSEPPADQLTQEPVQQTEPEQEDNPMTKIKRILQEYANETRTMNNPNLQTDEKAESNTNTVFKATEQQDAKVNAPNFEELLQEAKELKDRELLLSELPPGSMSDYANINVVSQIDTRFYDNPLQVLVVTGRNENGDNTFQIIDPKTLQSTVNPNTNTPFTVIPHAKINFENDEYRVRNLESNTQKITTNELEIVEDGTTNIKPSEIAQLNVRNGKSITIRTRDNTFEFKNEQGIVQLVTPDGNIDISQTPFDLSTGQPTLDTTKPSSLIRAIGNKLVLSNQTAEENPYNVLVQFNDN